ncbi:MAG: hypothetical protein QM741_17685 [Rudaea sp.]|uniref:hypothetical protein n=1 Tax=Rudaea sp. TaxID=2136325 RepID=UPI0039E3A8C2
MSGQINDTLPVTPRDRPVRSAFKVDMKKPREIVAKTRAAAAGDPYAMKLLADGLRACAEVSQVTNDQIENREAQLTLKATANNADGQTQESGFVRYAAQHAAEQEAARNTCAGIVSDESAKWSDWLKTAAAAGDPGARVSYAENYPALARKGDVPSDELEQYRSDAFDYLENELAQGNCSAEVLNALRYVSPNPATTYVYDSILFGKPRPPSADPAAAAQEAARQSIIAKRQAAVPPDQLDDANAARDYVLQNYCQNRM